MFRPPYVSNAAPPTKLSEWLAWQEALHGSAIDLGLERCTAVANNMGLLSPDFTVISVAGTNGKGSSVAMLESILGNAGYKTGSYTSPHLIFYNERIRLDGLQVTDQMLCTSFDRVEQARQGLSLTYFEFGTLAALDIFHRAGIEVGLLEVGLGGRLDAVNCIDADLALISSIDLDHQQWLGVDRNAIGREKAGIFRCDAQAVCSDPAPPESVLAQAEQLGTTLYIPGRDFSYQLTDGCWDWRCGDAYYEALPNPSRHNSCQIQNAAGVLMALQALSTILPVSSEVIRKGLRDFNLPGRFQLAPNRVLTILDVAHNRQAAKMLAHNLRQLPNPGKTQIIIGMLKEKDHRAVLSELLDIADGWHLVSLTGPRGSHSKALKKALLKLDVSVPISEYDSVIDAFTAIKEKVDLHDRIVVTGSFLSVGEAINYFNL